MSQPPTIEEEIQPELEPTPVYRCKEPSCKAWVREEFLSADKSCPICKGPLARSIKLLPPPPKTKKSAFARRKR